MKATPKIGDPLLAWVGAMVAGNGLPVGARAVEDPGDGISMWIDICTLGQHLPQRYRLKEIEPLTEALCEKFGLCTGCMGYGSLAAPGTIPLAAGLDEIPDPCPDCTGTGKPYMRVAIVRTANSVEARLEVIPHEIKTAKEVAWCVHCGIVPGSDAADLANHVPSTKFNP